MSYPSAGCGLRLTSLCNEDKKAANLISKIRNKNRIFFSVSLTVQALWRYDLSSYHHQLQLQASDGLFYPT